MKRTPNLKVLNPCEQSFEAMPTVDKDCKFCHQCATKIYDFSNCTEEEFLEIFKANNGKVCGRIKATPKLPPQATYTPSRWTSWFFSLLAFIGFGVASCSNDSNGEHHEVGIVTINHHDTVPHKVGKVTINQDSTQQE